MNPGAAMCPSASMVRFAETLPILPISAILPSLIATEPSYQGLPLPSRMWALMMTMSYWVSFGDWGKDLRGKKIIEANETATAKQESRGPQTRSMEHLRRAPSIAFTLADRSHYTGSKITALMPDWPVEDSIVRPDAKASEFPDHFCGARSP